MKILRTIPLFALILLLVGCTFRGFVMRNYTWFATHYMNRFFDLDSDQRTLFKEELRIFAGRIQAERIDPIIKTIEEIPLASDPTAQIASLERTFIQIAAEGCTAFQNVLASLGEKQLANFEDQLREGNEHFDPEHNHGLEKMRAKHISDTKKVYKTWIGSLDEYQEDLIKSWYLEPSTQGVREQAYLLYRNEYQTILVSILKQHRGHPVELGKECSRFVTKPEERLTTNAFKSRTEGQQRRANIIVNLLKSLSPKQRSHLDSEISDLKADLLRFKRDAQAAGNVTKETIQKQ